MVVDASNPLPVTVRMVVGEPAAIAAGLIEDSVGVGCWSVMVVDALAPPPGGGAKTEMVFDDALEAAAAAIVAVMVVELTPVTETFVVEPFHITTL